MRRATVAALTLLILAVLAAPAAAHPGIELPPTLPTDLSFAATDNVEYLGRVPEHFGTAGGRLDAERDVYFVTDSRTLTAYDVRVPANPVALGTVPMFQTANDSSLGTALAQEDPDFGTVTVDGEERHVLVVDASPTGGASLFTVVDITDPTDMDVAGTLDITDHTWTCVSGPLGSCQFVYGRDGHIIDLTDPTAPVPSASDWRAVTGYNDYTHDFTEVRPGLVVLDTTDPELPRELQRIEQLGRFSELGYHSVEWANDGNDPILVLGTEIAPSGATSTAGSDCQGEESVIETWSADALLGGLADHYDNDPLTVREIGEFERLDTYDVSGRGIFLDGDAPGHVLYCAHWMELAPSFDDGGMMAVSYYDRGTRFVEVAEDGTMSERGWIVAAESYSGSVQWVTDEILYIHDYRRGMEVIRLNQQEATDTYEFATDLVAVGSDAKHVAGGPVDRVPALSSALLAGLMGLAEIRRRRASSASTRAKAAKPRNVA